MPNPTRLLTTLRQAIAHFRATPGRTGRFTQLPDNIEVLIVGDMHGHLENLSLVLQVADLTHHPQRHLVLQEIIHGPFAYPAGGDKSHQMLDVLAALKCQYPQRVHYLLGNHELAQWQNQRIGKGDVDQNYWFLLGVQIAYPDHWEALYQAYLELFNAADLALRTANRIFLSHTLPSAKYLPNFDMDVLQRTELQSEDIHLGGAVHSLVWGRDLSQKNIDAFLQKVDADLLISGHVPCEQGFLVPNDRQIILDALGYPACYCLFPSDRPLTQQDLLDRIRTL